MKHLGRVINPTRLPSSLKEYLDLAVRLELGSEITITTRPSMLCRAGVGETKINAEDMLDLIAHNMLRIQHLVAYIKAFVDYIGCEDNNHTSIDVKRPQQRDCVSCKYFVLRFMRDLIYRKWNGTSEPFVKNEERYTAQQLNEVREEWLDFVAEFQ